MPEMPKQKARHAAGLSAQSAPDRAIPAIDRQRQMAGNGFIVSEVARMKHNLTGTFGGGIDAGPLAGFLNRPVSSDI